MCVCKSPKRKKCLKDETAGKCREISVKRTKSWMRCNKQNDTKLTVASRQEGCRFDSRADCRWVVWGGLPVFQLPPHILQSNHVRPIGSSKLLASMSCVPFLLLPIGGAVAGATALASHSQNAVFFFFHTYRRAVDIFADVASHFPTKAMTGGRWLRMNLRCLISSSRG